MRRVWLATAVFFASATWVSAADTTPPTTPVVTDDGAYTTSLTQLHAVWTASSDQGVRT